PTSSYTSFDGTPRRHPVESDPSPYPVQRALLLCHLQGYGARRRCVISLSGWTPGALSGQSGQAGAVLELANCGRQTRGLIMARIFKHSYTSKSADGRTVQHETDKWYGECKDLTGRTIKIPLSPDKKASRV